jgi:hypothetical protein
MKTLAASNRNIARLRIRAPSHDDARHVAVLLEDAFRTASLPDAEQGRFVVIRRLNLRQVDHRVSPASLALQLEALVRAAARVALPISHPQARTAEAIVFRDRVEALRCFARRFARGEPMTEWFWPAAIPGWTQSSGRSDAWFQLLEIASSLPASALAEAAIVEEAVRAAAVEELVDSLPPGCGRRWSAATGLSEVQKTGSSAPTIVSNSVLHFRRGDLIRAVDICVSKNGFRDDRTVWLATSLAIVENSNRSSDSNLPERVRLWLEASFAARQEQVDSRTLTVPTPISRTGISSRVSDIAPVPESVPVPGEITSCGGLLFLLAVLQRLGLPQFLAQDPHLAEAGFASALLLNIGACVGLPTTDPLALALASGVTDLRPDVVENCILPDSIARHPCPTAALPFGPWRIAVRRWVRLHGRMGLFSLIRRRAMLQASHTQLDLCFNLNQIDIRIRRAGLDINPGWLPWFGRIVRFHYAETYAY